MEQSRIATIEGQQVVVVERTPPLPRRLDALMALMYALTVRVDFAPAGARRECEVLREHRLQVIRQGLAMCTDRQLRELRVEMCRDCGAACVRDITYDRMPGLTVGRRGPFRRNHILGWYSGKRRAGREFL